MSKINDLSIVNQKIIKNQTSRQEKMIEFKKYLNTLINLISDKGIDSIKFNFQEKINQFQVEFQVLNDEIRKLKEEVCDENEKTGLFIEEILLLEKENFSNSILLFQKQFQKETSQFDQFAEGNLIDEINLLIQNGYVIVEKINDCFDDFKYSVL